MEIDHPYYTGHRYSIQLARGPGGIISSPSGVQAERQSGQKQFWCIFILKEHI